MLIQALFRLVGYNELNAKIYFGLALNDLPEPTGDFDLKTGKAIWAFQRKMIYKLLNLDGKVHPASYQNRVLKNAFKNNTRLMIITLLNIYAIDGALINYSGDVKLAVKQMAPKIILR